MFHNNWISVGLAVELQAPGSYSARELRGRHYLCVRDADGTLRGFHNVCRHHAARLASGSGTCGEIVCPYHGWTYTLDGSLKRAPRIGGIRNFDRDRFHLLEIGVRQWGPFLFLHPGRDHRDLDHDLAGALDPVDLVRLRHVASREYRLRCNWKVFVDNYLDGGYHVPVLHAGLSSGLDLASYRTEVFPRFSVQTCDAKEASRGPAGDERLAGGARYVWIYPNLMLNRYGPMLDANRVMPLATDETLVVFDWFVEPDQADDAAFIERALAASHRVQEEDIAICESVQSGLASPVYDRGRYAPRLEIGENHFHRLLAEDLRR